MTDPKLAQWLGRREETADLLSLNLVERIAATLGDPLPAPGTPLPLLWHWAFFQAPVTPDELGPDGHPVLGGFLPPADNRNRMWAGGRVEFIEPLITGDEAQRVSTITGIEEKTGRSGTLLFVTLSHEYLQNGRTAIRERQDLVYRTPAPPRLTGTDPLPAGDWNETVQPTPTLLFRYSAITFNGHRIHYDHPYATETEGYPGLVVHGPLIATLVLRAFCRARPEARPHRFEYRGLRPLIAPRPFRVGGRIADAGTAELWAGDEHGMAQRATVTFG